VALWYVLARYSSTRRTVRVVIAIVVASVIVVQAFFFRFYHTSIDAQVVVTAAHGWRDVRPVLAQMLPRTIATIALVALAEYSLLARVSFASHPPQCTFGFAMGAGAFFIAMPLRDATPELRLLDALSVLLRPGNTTSSRAIDVAALPSTERTLPSIVLIVTESVRAQDYCSQPSDNCQIAPEVNRLLPNRVPFLQMRALASYTAVSLSVIITGRSQERPRDEISEAPNVFDFARSVRARDERLRVAYWSAHSESVFERKDIKSHVDSWMTLETLLGRDVDDDPTDDGFDRLLTARAMAELPKLKKPFLLVLHFAGTHAPYFTNDADAPFQPSQHEITWSGMPALANAYRNSIHEQDKSIAIFLRAFLDLQGSSPYLIAFTSDHGEAFGEHGAIHHGQSLWDEQIHVPGFVATSPGLLSIEQESALRAHANAYVTHLDLLPTILDTLGVLDGFAMAPYRHAFRGESLLRARPQSDVRSPIPITNCTGLFPCPVNTWGLLDGPLKLEAEAWDADFRCSELEKIAGGGETPLAQTDARCTKLRNASKKYFDVLPNRRPNR
jgi:hypothetical protein